MRESSCTLLSILIVSGFEIQIQESQTAYPCLLDSSSPRDRAF